MLGRAADREPLTGGPLVMVGRNSAAEDRSHETGCAGLDAAGGGRGEKEIDAGSGPRMTQGCARGAAATERALRDALPRAGRIHIAAPFRINAASPLFSSIVLTEPAPPPHRLRQASGSGGAAAGPGRAGRYRRWRARVEGSHELVRDGSRGECCRTARQPRCVTARRRRRSWSGAGSPQAFRRSSSRDGRSPRPPEIG